MSKANKPLFLVAALAVAAYFYYKSAGNFIDTVKVKVHKIKIDLTATFMSAFQYIFLPTTFNLINETKFSATVNRMELNFLYKDKLIGRVTREEPFTINPNGSTMLQSTIRVSTAEIINIAPQWKSLLINGFDVVIKGKAVTTLGDVRINETVNLKA